MLGIQRNNDGHYWFFTMHGISVETYLKGFGLPVNGGNANGGQLPDGVLFIFNEGDPLYQALFDWDYDTYPEWQPVVGADGNMTGIEPFQED